MDKTFLTVKELSTKLDVSEKTIYRMINSKSIPFAIKIGGQWRFNSEKIEKWILDSQKGGQNRAPTNDKIRVADALANGLIIYRAHGESRDEILDEILGMVALSGDEAIMIKKQILYAESIISSSLQGLAFMAPDVDGSYHIEESKLLVAFLEKSMDFKAIDNIETEIVLLLLAANKNRAVHIKNQADETVYGKRIYHNGQRATKAKRIYREGHLYRNKVVGLNLLARDPRRTV